MKTLNTITTTLQKYCSSVVKPNTVTSSVIIFIKSICYIIGIIMCVILTHQPSKAITNNPKYCIEMMGKVKKVFYNQFPIESAIDSAWIIINDETNQLTRTCYSDNTGKCQFELPLDKQFEIQISKKGYVPKIINVDSRIPTKKNSVYTVIFDMYLFEDIKGLDVSLLKAPIAKIVFNKDSNNFVYDRKHVSEVNEKVQKIYLSYYHQKFNPQKKISIEAQQKYIEVPQKYIEAWHEYGEVQKENIVFQVQLIAMHRRLPLKSSIFSKCGEVNESFINGLYKYTVGEFRSLAPAQELLSQIVFIGFTDAFIVAVKDEKRIAVNKAVTLLKR